MREVFLKITITNRNMVRNMQLKGIVITCVISVLDFERKVGVEMITTDGLEIKRVQETDEIGVFYDSVLVVATTRGCLLEYLLRDARERLNLQSK